ncbi:MAG: PDC sensor domain-containing protein [Desulfamplus sp.]|nr:PDC sensor domain-containing protein [Desulfamplus sp.]
MALTTGIAFAEKAPAKVYELAKTTLQAYGSDPVIIKAVKEENQKKKTLQQIKEMDQKWKNTPGITDYMKAMIESECGRYIMNIQNNNKYYDEIFVMDDQGANVAMTDKTSDYWQGDEDKFKKSFKDGAGDIFVDEVEFDDSTKSYLVQVSVPVIEDGKAIGAITFGINIDNIE